MIDKSIIFLKKNNNAKCTILGMKINNKKQFNDMFKTVKNPNISMDLSADLLFLIVIIVEKCKKNLCIFAFRNFFLNSFFI